MLSTYHQPAQRDVYKENNSNAVNLFISFSDGDKDSDEPSESGDNTSDSTQGLSGEPAQERGSYLYYINRF